MRSATHFHCGLSCYVSNYTHFPNKMSCKTGHSKLGHIYGLGTPVIQCTPK